LNHTSRCIPVVVALAAVATIVAGCSDTRFAGSNASTDPVPGHEQAYKTSYGFDSSGPTTDVYTELFGSRKRDDGTAPASVTASGQPMPAPGGVRQGAAAPAAGVNQQQAAAPAPAVVEQPAGPPPQAAAYGLTSDGPTTDVYTMLFGPRH
jgi:hypothetical protein